MTSKNLSEYLYSFCKTPQYNHSISLHSKFTKMKLSNDKMIYQAVSNPIQILPPAIWFIVDQGNCLSSVKNDVEKSLKSKAGLMVSIKGNNMNEAFYLSSQQDINSIQESQDCFCISYGVIKEQIKQYVKHIGVQLRSCLIQKANIAQTNSKNQSYASMDQITKKIYKKYRIFLIFDTVTQPQRILVNHCCYYPNVKFSIQKINIKDNIKYSPSPELKQLKQGKFNNTYGFLSLDTAERFLIIKKGQLELQSLPIIGLWVIGSFPLKRTRKQFGKEDAIWQALFEFYTNKSIKNKIYFMAPNKGILCYFAKNAKSYRPQFYLFEIDKKNEAKWSFTIKSQVFSDWNRPYQVKFDFQNATIMQEKEYSQFSDQNTPEDNKFKNQNINKQNVSQHPLIFTKNSIKSTEVKQQIDPKDVQIAKLKQQLQMYKNKCSQLQMINKMLIQQKMMNYQQMYMNQMQPNQMMYQFGMNNIPPYNPLSFSQVSAPNLNNIQNMNNIPNNNFYPQSNGNEVSLANSRISKASQQIRVTPSPAPTIQQIKPAGNKAKFAFEETPPQIINFSHKYSEESPVNKKQDNQKVFIKKKLSQQEPMNKNQVSETLKNNSQTIRDIFVRPDARNISFQDSFVQYHSDKQKEPQQQENIYFEQQNLSNRSNQNYSEQIQKKKSDQYEFRSPQFKRFQSQQQQKQVDIEARRQIRNPKSLKIENDSSDEEKPFKRIKNVHSPKTKEQNILSPRNNKKKDEGTRSKKALRLESDDSDDGKIIKKKAPISPRRGKLIKDSDSSDSDNDAKFKELRKKYAHKK